MTNPILKRTILASLLAMTAFAALGCKTTTTATTVSTTVNPKDLLIPQVSSPNAVFFQGNGYDVTYGEFFDDFKRNDGINQLLTMVDEILFTAESAAVTQGQIDEKILFLTYGTTDSDEIAGFTADEVEDFVNAYEDNMYLLGYGNNPEDYVRMMCAKENYAVREMIDPENAEKSWYIGEEEVADYYTKSYFEDIAAIKIRLLTQNGAKALLRKFNLVSYHTELRLYTGTVPIGSVYSFTDENTRVLTDAELLTKFIQMYNEVYGGYRELLPEAATIADLKAHDDLKVTFKTLNTIDSPLTSFVFDTLGALENTEDPRSYTHSPFAGKVGTEFYLILKVADANDKQDLSGFEADTADLATLIGQDVYDEIEAILIDEAKETAGVVSSIICNLRSKHDLEIFDYYLGLDYLQVDPDFTNTTVGHPTIVASFDEETITADDLLTEVMEKNAALYSLYAAQMGIEVSRYFPQIYCHGSATCELDVTKNASERIIDHQETLADLKESFEGSYYVDEYSWEEWLYLAYGVKSETDMIANYYVKSVLQPWIIYEGLRADSGAMVGDPLFDLMQEYYDGYFSLFAESLSIYVDRDEDGIPDDYSEFQADLADPIAYDALITAMESDIRTYLTQEEKTFSTLVSEYKAATFDDPIWGDYRKYGLILSLENLSETTALTYVSVMKSVKEGKLDQSLADGLVAAYQTYLLEENLEADYLYATELVETGKGLSLLKVEQGTNFERPSAKFTNTKNANDEWVYAVGTTNENDLPSLDQLKLYCEYRFDQMVYGTDPKEVLETYGVTVPALPAGLLTALDAFFAPVHDSMYVIGFLNMKVIEDMGSGTFVNSVSEYCDFSNAELQAALAALNDIYLSQVFPESTDIE